MKFCTPSELRLWRTGMLLLTKSKGHKPNPPTQDSQSSFKPNLTCIFLSARTRYIISNPDGGLCRLYWKFPYSTRILIFILISISVFQACYFDRDDVALKGFVKRFRENSEEERGHAMKLMDYQNMRGGRVVLQDVCKPQVCFVCLFIWTSKLHIGSR